MAARPGRLRPMACTCHGVVTSSRRFEQVGDARLFAVLSNGELLVAPLASLQWKRELTELDDVHALTSMKKETSA